MHEAFLRRIRPQTGSAPAVWDPLKSHPGSSLRFDPLAGLTTASDPSAPVGGCLQCPDAPCVRFDAQEISADVGAEVSCATDNDVCPVGALTIQSGAPPEISTDICIGCGLCVRRCPVGALTITAAGHPIVQEVAPPERQVFRGSSGEFRAARDELAQSITRLAVDPEQLVGLAGRAVTSLVEPDRGNARRLDPRWAAARLVRNALLTLNIRSCLSVRGNNSDPCEFTACLPEHGLVLGEIEAGGDGLDATRKVTTGVAVARARWSLGATEVIPVVVIARMPNSRTDVYRLIDDLATVLGLNIALVPLASLIAAVIADDAKAAAYLLAGGAGAGAMERPALAFSYAFGEVDPDALTYAGITPQK